jgi:ketosteroid isomerase-like protein
VTSSANLDLVRSIFANWERGDFHSIDWADPEIEYVIADGPAPGSWTGLTAMEAVFRERISVWDDYRFTADEYRELDDERELVLIRRSGRGKTSGLELDELQTRGANVFHVCDGKVAQFVNYYDYDRALADLGITPEGGMS